MNFNIISFGCKVNSYESHYMKEQLLKNGYFYSDDYKTSDIVIVNTCSVTNTADNKCKKMIRSVRRENGKCILMVCGCTSENNRDKLNELDIDIMIGNNEKSKVVELIENFIKDRTKFVKFYNTRNVPFENMEIDEFSDMTRAYVKIQDGCNNFCAYCIIPYVRGNIRSKDIDVAYNEIKALVDKGHKEIVFTGINTGAYGKEHGKYDLVDLIKRISVLDGLERIRISSIEITEIEDRLINEMKINNKLCGHLHVSLQSGSERILKLMDRKYTKDEYEDKINKLREARPNINLTTDVIVGFPGETEEDFLECVDYCKKIGFSKIHVFPFSKREGTKAAGMSNQLDNAIKKQRARRLIEIDDKLQKEYNDKFLGTKVNVLVEEVIDGKSVGHTENFLKVIIDEILETNRCYDVIVYDTDITYVMGKVVENEN